MGLRKVKVTLALPLLVLAPETTNKGGSHSLGMRYACDLRMQSPVRHTPCNDVAPLADTITVSPSPRPGGMVHAMAALLHVTTAQGKVPTRTVEGLAEPPPKLTPRT
jgi:hypothetical protein